MIGPARKWRARQKLLAERQPQVRIDSVIVTEGEQGYYNVVIEGFGLLPAVTPPQITVGGVALDQARFEDGGRRVTAVLRNRVPDAHVVLDLNYARVEGHATFL